MVNFEFCSCISDYTRDALILPFLRSVSRNGATRRKYASVINLVCSTLDTDFYAITVEDVDRLSSLYSRQIKRGEIAEGTAAMRFSVCTRLGDYIERSNADSDYENPFRHSAYFKTAEIVSSSSLPSVSEVDAILSAAAGDEQLFLIITLSFRCALSTSQILTLTRAAVSSDDDGNMFLHFKDFSESDERLMRLPDDVAELLSSFLDHLTKQDSMGHLFYSKKLKKPTVMSDRTLQYAVRKLVSGAGLKKDYTLQDIKNKGLSMMIAAGALPSDIEEYTSLGERALIRFKESLNNAPEVIPPDLVHIKVVK